MKTGKTSKSRIVLIILLSLNWICKNFSWLIS